MIRLFTFLVLCFLTSCEYHQPPIPNRIAIEFFQVRELSNRPPLLVRQYEPDGIFEIAEPANYHFSDWKEGVLDITISKFPCRIDVEFTEGENAFYDQFTLQVLARHKNQKITLVRCADLNSSYDLGELFCIFDTSER